MADFMLFGAQLKTILKNRGVSASQLSRLMGFKSKTTLFRVLNDEVTYASLQSFWRKMTQRQPLPLTQEEWSQLEQSLNVSRQGLEACALNQAMHELLHPSQQPFEDIPVRCFGQDAPRVQSLRELMRFYRQSPRVHITLVNCTQSDLLRLICQSLSPESMQIHHLLNLNDTLLDTVRSIGACLPLLPYACYTPYALSEPLRSSELFVIFHNGEGQWETHYFLFTAQGELCMMASRDKDFPSFWKAALQDPLVPFLQPLKVVLGPLSAPSDFVGFIQRYYELEKERALYSIKPDVPINFIHPDLLVDAVREGLNKNGASPVDETLISDLYDIQLKRWQNFFEKRKVTHVIFSKEAMIRFARTGRQTDHFFVMRPYTAKEREAILTFLWEQAQSNPYFNLYFAHENCVIEDREISCYEGAGTVFQDANTSYNQDHQEVMITHPAFAQQFKRYFMNELLVNHVLSPRETQHLWDYLIALCHKG
ncbi:MAG: hypothetical protein IJ461_09725 [Clostridia bacterium]|nr:hypothetical protein [Clostridia bacterium]